MASSLLSILGGMVLIVAVFFVLKDGTRRSLSDKDLKRFFGDDQFIWVEEGQFIQGFDVGYDDQRPAHKVSFTGGFELSKFEVTQAQWEAVTGLNIRKQRDQADPSLPLKGEGPDHPVYYVSWDDIQAFIVLLNEADSSYVYRLPTEAEWEYACRAGTTGDWAGNLEMMAWYRGNSGGETHPVGSKNPNAWGLYDMHGNVWEWVQDFHAPYPTGSVIDPLGSSTGTLRELRGGGWYCGTPGLRSGLRYGRKPTDRHAAIGFRIVREKR